MTALRATRRIRKTEIWLSATNSRLAMPNDQKSRRAEQVTTAQLDSCCAFSFEQV